MIKGCVIMYENGKRTPQERRNLLLSICAVLVVTLILLVYMLVSMNDDKSSKPTNNPSVPAISNNASMVKELLVNGVQELDDSVIVTTSYCVVSYPHAFCDLIQVDATTYKNYAQLDFSAKVGNEERLLYSLMFNGTSGISVGTIMVDGVQYKVTAEIYELNDVGEELRMTFSAAQETFNDIMMSLAENPGFVSA